MKKSLTFSIGLIALTGAGWFAIEYDFKKEFNARNCPFCTPSIIERQEVLKGNGCMALLNHKPAVLGHILVIPERHVERFEDLTKEEIGEIHSLIVKVDQAERRVLGSTGYLLLQKNGQESGQTVPHAHFHYYPRSVGQSKAAFLVRMLVAHFLPPLSEQELSEQKLRFQGNGFVD